MAVDDGAKSAPDTSRSEVREFHSSLFLTIAVHAGVVFIFHIKDGLTELRVLSTMLSNDHTVEYFIQKT